MDMCLGALIWYLFGFGIPGAGNSFIGNDGGNFALGGFTKDDFNDRSADYSALGYDWVSFFFSYTFAAAGAICLGCHASHCASFCHFSIAMTVSLWLQVPPSFQARSQRG